MANVITPRAKDSPQWYLDIVKGAGLYPYTEAAR